MLRWGGGGIKMGRREGLWWGGGGGGELSLR